MKLFKSLTIGLVALLALAGCTSPQSAAETVTIRLWDDNVAAAYTKSFAEFTKDSGIKVKVNVIPWSEYWSQLRVDLTSRTADDIFWVNAGNFEEYATQNLLLPIEKSEFDFSAWDNSVITQYSKSGKLWGVPQLSDPGIGLFYNKDLLDKYGVTLDQVKSLQWYPSAKSDSLRETAIKLTRDQAGRTPTDAKFDAARTQTYGFNSAFDLNAIVLNFLGSNGASWQTSDQFNFDSAEGRATFQYLVDLITKYRVSPPATDTNPPAGGDTARNLFIQGRMALFESGAYNLANVQAGAKFHWGVTQIPAGPAGAISVTNGIVAAANAKSEHKDAQLKVLKWLAGAGAKYIGSTGSALTAVTSERSSFFNFWKSQNIDVTPMVDVLKNGYVQAPRGAKYGEAETAYLPYFTAMFEGKLSVTEALSQAQAEANKVMGK